MLVFTLDWKGTIAAIALAAGMLLFGRGLGPFFFVAMLYFLVSSTIVTYVGSRRKKQIRLYQKRRGIKNVLANGLWPFITVILFFFFGGKTQAGGVIVVGFMSSVAAVTADKFSSEIGVLDGTPTMLIGFKKVKKGTSGAVTALGLGIGAIGALLLSLLMLLLPIFWGIPLSVVPGVLAVLIGGVSGNLFDSLAGYYEEKGIGNKSTSNIICGITGSAAGSVVYLLLASGSAISGCMLV
jgi:uncharacterized protein (TIGR00297 family)